MNGPTVAMIGSFRKHLGVMQESIDEFTRQGIEVVNPQGTIPLDAGVEFVRFPTDEVDLSDAEIEMKALGRILGATAIYVVCPNGYTGLTTSYEWGFIEVMGRPTYFSELPEEWFMRRYAPERVVTAKVLSGLIISNQVEPLKELRNL